MRRFLFTVVTLGAIGCDDPLEPLERIEDLRVLGARVEVQGDPQRAAPAPGESVSVRWLVAAPELRPALGWALAACVAKKTNVGIPSCETPPFATVTSATAEPSVPELLLTIPAAVDPSQSPRIAVLGSICQGALPQGRGETSHCPDGAQGTQVSLEFELARPKDVNSNPRFAELPLLFDGAEWTAPDELPAACVSSDLPQVSAGSGVHEVALAVAADARDAVPQEGDLDASHESLLLSHFSTAGELERAFSTLGTDMASTEARVPWTAPKSAPPEGLTVRFWFVVRDFRGGSDFLERALCVLP